MILNKSMVKSRQDAEDAVSMLSWLSSGMRELYCCGQDRFIRWFVWRLIESPQRYEIMSDERCDKKWVEHVLWPSVGPDTKVSEWVARWSDGCRSLDVLGGVGAVDQHGNVYRLSLYVPPPFAVQTSDDSLADVPTVEWVGDDEIHLLAWGKI